MALRSGHAIPRCTHTGLPMVMCAHCQSGFADPADPSKHPFNRPAPVVFYARSSDRMRDAAVEGSRRGAYGTPRTAWGQQAQLRTILDLYADLDTAALDAALQELQV